MVRKNKRPAFDESDSDGGPGSGFQEYLNNRSAQSSKRAKSTEAIEAASSSLQVASPCEDVYETKESSPTVIDGLLKSKRQRKQDKLHIQSIKSRLENELDKPKDTEELVFITDEYKAKREEYDRADLLAEQEMEQEDTVDPNEELMGSSRSVALRSLMKTISSDKHLIPNIPQASDRTQQSTQKTKFENDVYRSPSYQAIKYEVKLAEDTTGLDPEQKKLCIEEFLKSTKTAQDIRRYISHYEKKHNVHVD